MGNKKAHNKLSLIRQLCFWFIDFHFSLTFIQNANISSYLEMPTQSQEAIQYFLEQSIRWQVCFLLFAWSNVVNVWVYQSNRFIWMIVWFEWNKKIKLREHKNCFNKIRTLFFLTFMTGFVRVPTDSMETFWMLSWHRYIRWTKHSSQKLVQSIRCSSVRTPQN